MENWVKISLLLCTFGVLKEFRPSEPFITKYFNQPPVNFTLDEINSKIYPVGTYSSMALLIILFLVTDFFCYKPIIILEGISGIITYILLVVTRSLPLAQLAEVFYGLFIACDVAYYTYIYAKVEKKHYQEVTGYTRAAYLFGRAFSGIVSQILVSTNSISYYNLNFITLAGMIVATFWTIWLPPVNRSLYFHRRAENSNSCQEVDSSLELKENEGLDKTFEEGFKKIWIDFQFAFTNLYVVKWAFWWALALCGYYQILSYIQVLWEEIAEDVGIHMDSNWNGAVEAVYTILSAIASFGCGKLILNWEKFGEVVLAFCSILIGILLYIMSQCQAMWIAYLTYIIYTIINNSMITISNSEIAKNVNPDSHGLIFGITMFLALLLETIMAIVVNSYLSLSGRIQFLVYASYFTILGAVFAVIALFSFLRIYFINKKDILVSH